MQALILAAGSGQRLRPITDTVPKSLVKVNGISLLENALQHLSHRDISEVIIVVGDKKEKVVAAIGYEYGGMRIIYVENPLYNVTNNVYSLWLARNYIHGDLLMLECDLFYRRSLIDEVLSGKADCNILVSPFDKSCMNGTVVTADPEGRVTSLVIKRDQTGRYDYSDKLKTVNIYFFRKAFVLDCYFPAIETYIKTQSVQSYYELVLGSLIYFGNNDIRIVPVSKDEWKEIDDMEDLKIAEAYFRQVDNRCLYSICNE